MIILIKNANDSHMMNELTPVQKGEGKNNNISPNWILKHFCSYEEYQVLSEVF